MSISYFLVLILKLLSIKTQSAPNIVFILVDDSGWGNWGYHNNGTNGEIATPNVDSLARNGLILNRHYVHYVCSPTRSSLNSGRLPVHCNLGNGEVTSVYNGIPINYTCIATKLKQANYSTHLVGKWDAGMTVKEQLPTGRGYDTSFGYLQAINHFWTERQGTCGPGIVDLWLNNAPAFGLNNTIYEEYMFANRVYDIINNHNKDLPLFLVYATHIPHTPYQIPKDKYFIYPNDENMCSSTHANVYPGFNRSNPDNYHCRSLYQSMVNLLDVIVGNITSLLKSNDLWNNTLLIFTGDNGGPENNITAANNYPLRGGKFVPFEGGIRTASFINGGFLPQSRKGKVENGMMHIADWYATFCALNGIDTTDTKAAKAGLPPIDSLNVWDMLSGKNITSPRYEIAVDNFTLIQGNYKLINNTKVDYASWTGVFYPNSTTPKHTMDGQILQCSNGKACLFDVVNDITEHNDISGQNTEIVQKMMARLTELKKGYYTNNEKGFKDLCPDTVNSSDCACWMTVNTYKGFYGPYQTLEQTYERGIMYKKGAKKEKTS